ncbi:unnamed protein product [Trichobilharzia regenti]|nr:unnamed protein product [Trichobilharzia regenti]
MGLITSRSQQTSQQDTVKISECPVGKGSQGCPMNHGTTDFNMDNMVSMTSVVRLSVCQRLSKGTCPLEIASPIC